MPRLLLFLLLLLPLCLMAQPVRILFDTDMGSDCDDAGALALLHQLAAAGEAEIVGCVYSSGRVPYGAAVVEAINLAYGQPYIPIGACHDSTFGDPVDKMSAGKLAHDTAAYGHRRIHNQNFPKQVAFLRRLLAEFLQEGWLLAGDPHGVLEEEVVGDPDQRLARVGLGSRLLDEGRLALALTNCDGFHVRT